MLQAPIEQLTVIYLVKKPHNEKHKKVKSGDHGGHGSELPRKIHLLK